MTLEKIQMAVEVEVADAHSHAGLFDAVVAQGRAAFQAFFAEGSVAIVHQQKTGARIASDENIRPAVIVEIGRNRGQAVASFDLPDARGFGHVGKSTVAVVAK